MALYVSVTGAVSEPGAVATGSMGIIESLDPVATARGSDTIAPGFSHNSIH